MITIYLRRLKMKRTFIKSILALFLIVGSTFCLTNQKENINYMANRKSLSVDSTVNDAKEGFTNLEGPTFVCSFVNSKEDLENLSKMERKPANVILYVDENMNVTSMDGISISVNLENAIKGYLKGTIIPNIYLKTMQIADKFIDFINNQYAMLDMAIVSDNYEILSKVRSSGNGSFIRGVFDAREQISNQVITLATVVKNANLGKANAVIVPSSLTAEEVRYIYGRFKVVWMDIRSQSDLEIVSNIIKGVYGLLTDDIEQTFNCFTYFENTQRKDRNMNRLPINVGHRGSPYTTYENSLEGCLLATDNGATHIEVDGRITKDYEIVIMHDETIDRTTNGTGKVSDMTKEQIRQYKITKNYHKIEIGGEVDIPFIDDIFEAYKDKNNVIVYEIKDSNPNHVSILKQKIEKYGIQDRIVCISFNENQLIKMQEILPEIPCSTLNNYDLEIFSNQYTIGKFNSNNFCFDLNWGQHLDKFDFMMAARGFVGCYWTFDSANINQGFNKGAAVMTNNVPESYAKLPTHLVINEELSVETKNLTEYVVEVNYQTYIGSLGETKLEAKPLVIEKSLNGDYLVIFCAMYQGKKSSNTFRQVIFSAPTVVKNLYKGSSGNGCGGAITTFSGAISLSSLLLATLFIYRKKKENL